MRFLPVGLSMRNRPCVIVGGGIVGTRKAITLLRAGARVTVIAPTVSEPLAREIQAGRIGWVQEQFRAEHLAEAFLVVMATDDPDLNAAGAGLATQRGVLACDASSARDSQLVFGALLEEDGVVIGTFTDGRDPARARRTRDEIAKLLAGSRHDGSGRPGDSILIMVAHGSRNRDWGVPLEELAASIRSEVGGRKVRLAYAQFASPTLEEVVRDEVRSGALRIHVLPLFMTSEGHVDRDIRPLVDELQQLYPEIVLELMPPVGAQAQFKDVLVEIAKETVS